MFRLVVSEPETSPTPEDVVTESTLDKSSRPASCEPETQREDEIVAASEWKGKVKEQAVAPSSDSAIVLPDMTDEGDPDDDRHGDSEGDEDEDDWTKYEPPEELKTASGIESEILLQVIQDSIERIKARIAEDEARRQAEAEAEAEAEAARIKEKEEEEEESAKRDIDKGKQLEADIPLDGPARPPSPNRNPYAYAMSKKTLRIGPHGLLPTVATGPKSKKRSLFSLLKRLNGHGSGGGGSSDKGETSAAGAARHARAGSSASFEFTGRGRGRAALDAFKKATSSSSGGTGSSKSSMEEDVEVECVSCLDDVPSRETIRAPCHHYCRGCFRRLVATACENEQQWPPKCCLNTLPDETVLQGLGRNAAHDADLLRTWHARRAEWSTPVADRIYCSNRSCGQWCRPGRLDRARGIARCPAGHRTCAICRGPQHDGGRGACPQDRDLQQTTALAEEEGWKRCHGCGAYVEHREACQHMTCRCGAEFCYVCGAPWRTCGCTMEALAAVKRAAEDRRAGRAERDREADREAREVLEALRLVEEFEREERRKEELLRLERQRRELEARARREDARRRDVAATYASLRAELVVVDDAQRAAVAAARVAREEEYRVETERARCAAHERHAKATADAVEAAERALREREDELARECAARVAEERCIEEGYAARLGEYWERRWEKMARSRNRRKGEGGHDDGEGADTAVRGPDDDPEKEAKEAIRTALSDLQRRHDAGFAAWKRRADDEVETLRYAAREEQAIRAELGEEAERRLEVAARAERKALARRARADEGWIVAAVAERARMLDEMERVELETGGDDGDVVADLDAWLAGAAALDDDIRVEDAGRDGEDDADGDAEDDDDGMVYVDAEDDIGGFDYEHDLRDEIFAKLVDDDVFATIEDNMCFQHELLEFTVPGAFVT